jgi:tetratricopeptide (TPR) repeat protein
LSQLAAQLRDAPLNEKSAELFHASAKALAALPEEPLTADRVMCLLFVTRFADQSGNPNFGLAPALQAVEMAERIGDPLLCTKALKMLGVVYLESGSYPDTVSTLTKALDSAIAAGDRIQEAEILTNLGLAHQYAGHYGAAVPCYERAVELADEGRNPWPMCLGDGAGEHLAGVPASARLPGRDGGGRARHRHLERAVRRPGKKCSRDGRVLLHEAVARSSRSFQGPRARCAGPPVRARWPASWRRFLRT